LLIHPRGRGTELDKKANIRAQLKFGNVAVIEYSGWYIMCANKEELNLYFSLASKRKKIHLIIKKNYNF